MRRLAAFLIGMMLAAVSFSGEPTKPAPPAAKPAATCRPFGFSTHNLKVYEHALCTDGVEIIIPRPDLKSAPPPFTPSWKRWPNETEV